MDKWDGSAEQRGDPKFFDLFDIFGDIQIYRFGVSVAVKFWIFKESFLSHR
jgi:hypothetical protein